MADIVIQNLNNKVVISNFNSNSVLEDILNEGIDYMHACGGKGRCTSCLMIVIKGQEQLPPRNEHEERMALLRGLKDNERLACQTKALDHLTIKVAEKNKLPHMQYTE